MNDIINRYREKASATLGEACSLPFQVYHDPNVFQLESDLIFHNDWVFVCMESEIPEAGDYIALTIAGEASVVVREKDGKTRAMSNNCRHRGTPLLDDGFGKVGRLIVCPYHAWSYDIEGNLKGVPLAKQDNLDLSQHCLPQFHCDSFMNLVFVNLAETAIPVDQKLSGLKPYLDVFKPERFNRASSNPSKNWQANWKLAMENAMESYHLFKVHKETLETVTPSKQAYYIEGSSEWTVTGGKMVVQESKLAKWFRGGYPEAYNHYLLISLPPNFVGIMTYDLFSWLSVLPEGSEHSKIRAGTIFESPSDNESTESQEFTEAFFAEDKWICERVQKGMQSCQGSGGQLVEMERVVIDFHQYLASRLFSHTPALVFQSREPNPFQSP